MIHPVGHPTQLNEQTDQTRNIRPRPPAEKVKDNRAPSTEDTVKLNTPPTATTTTIRRNSVSAGWPVESVLAREQVHRILRGQAFAGRKRVPPRMTSSWSLHNPQDRPRLQWIRWLRKNSHPADVLVHDQRANEEDRS